MQGFDLKTWTNSDLFIVSVGLLGPVFGLVVFTLQKKLRNRPMSERARLDGSSIFLSSHIKDYAYWWLYWPSRVLIRLEVHPTTVTLGGLGVVCAGAALVGRGYLALGGVWILLGSLSDMLDGIVARERNLISREGGFIDSVVDRYSDLAIFAGLLYSLRLGPSLCAWVLLAAAGTAMVSYIRAKAESVGVRDVPKGSMQRAERTVYLGFGVYLSPLFVRHCNQTADTTPWLAVGVCMVIAVLANLSALRMVRYTIAALRAAPAPTSAHAKSLPTHA